MKWRCRVPPPDGRFAGATSGLPRPSPWLERSRESGPPTSHWQVCRESNPVVARFGVSPATSASDLCFRAAYGSRAHLIGVTSQPRHPSRHAAYSIFFSCRRIVSALRLKSFAMVRSDIVSRAFNNFSLSQSSYWFLLKLKSYEAMALSI